MSFPTRTKIVATLGPASHHEAGIKQLVKAGVDVFRLNCAHNDHETLIRSVRRVRKIAKQLDQAVGILADLQGPKIRVGPLLDAKPIWLDRGSTLIVSTAAGVVGQAGEAGETQRIGCRYKGLAKDVKPGEKVLLDDGIIELKVKSVEGAEITTRVVYGGLLHQFKGINLPGSEVSAKSLSKKDLDDLDVLLAHGIDFVALSFVRTAEEVDQLKARISKAGSDAQVIAKIERPEAVKNLEAIVAAADAVMVARGDMGVELGPEAVPGLQKKIIAQCIDARIPVITATQMLESMVQNPRPTRAEASDVANAIYDGTSAVMLSAETASGKHPVRAVKIMERIIRTSEREIYSTYEYTRRRRRNRKVGSSVAVATVRAAAYAAVEVDAKVLAVFTESGSTARQISGERVPTRMVAFTPFQRTMQRLALVWGVLPKKVPMTRTVDAMTSAGETVLLEDHLAKSGDRIVVVSGSIRQQGLTNIMSIRSLE